MPIQRPGMDEFDLQAEKEARAIRSRNQIAPDRRRKNEKDCGRRQPNLLERLLAETERTN